MARRQSRNAVFLVLLAPVVNIEGMKSGGTYRPGAAEFPHDNPLVDRLALWVGSALCELEAAARAAPASDDPETMPETANPSPSAHELAPLADATGEPAEDDRLALFVRTINEVALAHGAPFAAAHIESLFKFGVPAALELGASARAALLEGNILEATDDGMHATTWFTNASTAWQTILRGEPGDLSACGENTLDNWTADLIARLLANPSMAPIIRRDLRRRGIAAFGMLD